MPDNSIGLWTALIGTLTGWAATLVGGGICVGKHQQRLKQHGEFLSKLSEMLDKDLLMTKQDCVSFKETLKELKQTVEKLSDSTVSSQIAYATLSTKIDNLTGRIDKAEVGKNN